MGGETKNAKPSDNDMVVAKWEYLLVEIANKGRKILENGKTVKVHTKKSDLSELPRNMWNAKGKKMMGEAKGKILSVYGSKGWELVSADLGGDPYENSYIFKRKK